MQTLVACLVITVVSPSVVALEQHRLVENCDATDYPGPHITLYNNSVDEVFKTRPPRTFQADVYFALKWDKNTQWFRKNDQVNLTIKCDEQVFKWGRYSFKRNFTPLSSQQCVEKTMDHVSLPCNSQCVLVYSWMVNTTKFITGEIVSFKTAEHEPVGVLNVTRAEVTKNNVVFNWQVNNTLSCSKVVSLQVVLDSIHNTSEHELGAQQHTLNVSLPAEWTQDGEPFPFNLTMQYCTALGCSPFTQPLLLEWKPEEKDVLPTDGAVRVSYGGFLGPTAVTAAVRIALLTVCIILLIILVVYCCCCCLCCALRKRRPQYAPYKIMRNPPNTESYPKQLLTLDELRDVKDMAYQQVPSCASSVPRDDLTDYTSLVDLPNTGPIDDSCSTSSKGDCTKRMPGEGTEDGSDSEDSTSSLILGPDHSN